jgi:hypothetical protein
VVALSFSGTKKILSHFNPALIFWFVLYQDKMNGEVILHQNKEKRKFIKIFVTDCYQ